MLTKIAMPSRLGNVSAFEENTAPHASGDHRVPFAYLWDNLRWNAATKLDIRARKIVGFDPATDGSTSLVQHFSDCNLTAVGQLSTRLYGSSFTEKDRVAKLPAEGSSVTSVAVLPFETFKATLPAGQTLDYTPVGGKGYAVAVAYYFAFICVYLVDGQSEPYLYKRIIVNEKDKFVISAPYGVYIIILTFPTGFASGMVSLVSSGSSRHLRGKIGCSSLPHASYQAELTSWMYMKVPVTSRHGALTL
jgi:hypothetical protein